MFFSRLSWLDGSGLGFSLEYPTISLHAVSRDPNAYPQEHLYVMVNARFGGMYAITQSSASSDSKVHFRGQCLFVCDEVFRLLRLALHSWA